MRLSHDIVQFSKYWISSVMFQLLENINLLLVMVTNHVTLQLGEKPFEGLTEDELLGMEEEELLARGIEYMSKEKDDLKHKMKQVIHVLFFKCYVNFLCCAHRNF